MVADYEKQRLEQIARNKRIMEELGLLEAKAALGCEVGWSGPRQKRPKVEVLPEDLRCPDGRASHRIASQRTAAHHNPARMRALMQVAAEDLRRSGRASHKPAQFDGLPDDWVDDDWVGGGGGGKPSKRRRQAAAATSYLLYSSL